MLNPFLIDSPEDIVELLRKFPAQSRKRGESLFQKQAVKELRCVDPGSEYEADVEDTELYVVNLFQDPDYGWQGDCECLDGERCRHVYASLKALLAEHSVAQVQNLSGGGTASPSGKSDSQGLREKLIANLGRPLTKAEDEYLQLLRSAFRRSKETGQISTFELQRLKLPPKDPSQLQVRIAPFPLRTELELWQCLALFAKRQPVAVPGFMESLSDVQSMEERFELWQKQREVRSWRERFLKLGRTTETGLGTAAIPHQLRLRVFSAHLELEWQPPGMEDFVKPSFEEVDKLHADLNGGAASLSDPAAVIWSTLVDRSGFSRVTTYYYHDAATMANVGRLLRSPSLAPFIVSASGVPLHRPAGPLRWILVLPEEGQGAYRLKLVPPDGHPDPQILRVFEGSPPLYLCERMIYVGPSRRRCPFEPEKEHPIPIAAMESAEGIAWAQSLGIPLPEELLNRVRSVPMQVTIRCSLRPLHPGSAVELCVFEVRAQVPGAASGEVWTRDGWRDEALDAHEFRDSEAKSREIFVPSRSALECIPALMEPIGGDWERAFGSLSVRLTKKFPQMFADWLKSVPPHVEVNLEGELRGFAEGAVSGRVRLNVEESETDLDWFSLRVVLDVSDTELSQSEIKLLLNARGGYVRLAGKGWKRLAFDLTAEEDEQLARLGLSPKELSAEPQRMHVLQLADPASQGFLKEDQLAQIKQRAGELKARVTPDLPPGIDATLRPYQLQGFHFLAYLSENRFGGILADDMGLGKTLQTLTWLVWLRARSPESATKPILVVCPKSVMDNWRAEAAKFAGNLRVKLWPASELSEFSQRTSEADLHVMNYNQLRSLGPSLEQVAWLAVILDEGQYIKNPGSQTAQVARSLQAEHRLVLTGTPIENRLLDLWSLMAFAMPGMLGNRNQFGRVYDAKADPLARRRLSARVRPFLLRRTKAQVAKDLPERIEEDLLCELEGEQQVLYTAELKRAQQLLLRVKTQKELAKHQMHFLTSLLRLRQICCSPRLVNVECKEMGSKLEALLDQLEPLMEEGHKVLVFSQFVEMLNLIQVAVKARDWKHFYLAGDTEDRGELVQKFQSHDGAAVFLISLKAGGFGLNLTAASYVVLFDPWWNPAVENQAIDRTHRIGQTNNVIAYRLLIKGSVEEKIRVLQRRKSSLAQDVLGEEKFSQSLTLEDLTFLFG